MNQIVLHMAAQLGTSSRLIQINVPESQARCNAHALAEELEQAMKAIVDLFSTDYGLFSVGVIAFTLGMGVWFYRFFTRKMAESQDVEH